MDPRTKATDRSKHRYDRQWNFEPVGDSFCFLLVLRNTSTPNNANKSSKLDIELKLTDQGSMFLFDEFNIAQNAYCSRDIYLQLMKYLRSVILLIIIIQINARRRVSLVKINARFFLKGI